MTIRHTSPGGRLARLLLWIAFTAVLAAALLLLQPIWERKQLTDRLQLLDSQIAEQEILQPVYREILTVRESLTWPDLPRPERTKIQTAQVMEIPDMIRQLAETADIEIQWANPRVTSVANRRILEVDIKGMGPYPNLLAFFEAIIQLPYLDEIERMDILRGNLELELVLLARLALE
ncbi:MAG TPA: hypothetical protein PKE55_10190 [Kiritimatiellia bacterium]|nr:hypothetical protein [Kiritimatiellia bacterium]